MHRALERHRALAYADLVRQADGLLDAVGLDQDRALRLERNACPRLEHETHVGLADFGRDLHLVADRDGEAGRQLAFLGACAPRGGGAGAGAQQAQGDTLGRADLDVHRGEGRRGLAVGVRKPGLLGEVLPAERQRIRRLHEPVDVGEVLALAERERGRAPVVRAATQANRVEAGIRLDGDRVSLDVAGDMQQRTVIDLGLQGEHVGNHAHGGFDAVRAGPEGRERLRLDRRFVEADDQATGAGHAARVRQEPAGELIAAHGEDAAALGRLLVPACDDLLARRLPVLVARLERAEQQHVDGGGAAFVEHVGQHGPGVRGAAEGEDRALVETLEAGTGGGDVVDEGHVVAVHAGGEQAAIDASLGERGPDAQGVADVGAVGVLRGATAVEHDDGAASRCRLVLRPRRDAEGKEQPKARHQYAHDRRLMHPPASLRSYLSTGGAGGHEGDQDGLNVLTRGRRGGGRRRCGTCRDRPSSRSRRGRPRSRPCPAGGCAWPRWRPASRRGSRGGPSR